jgi:ABC-type phosphate transport system substrate-binding protein
VAAFKVVVNDANPVDRLSPEELSRLFLKGTTAWNGGEPVTPVDKVANSPERVSFSQSIHGRSVSAVKSYWQRQIFSGKGVPPPEKESDSEVLEFVLRRKGAVGYVATGCALVEGVKAVEVAP